MPRTARVVGDGMYYHVLNRGNGRMTLFHKPADYEAFVRVLVEGLERYPAVELLAWCLMSNHWHLVLRPRRGVALGQFMHWVGVTHVRRHHAHYHTAGGGHLYQGRFKSFPVQDDRHFLTLCRYVEANPLRARLVKSAETWPWSSLGQRTSQSLSTLPPTADWPVARPANWLQLVNRAMEEKERSSIETSLRRDRPFGGADWTERIAKKLKIEHTLRPRGRPRAEKE
jgi:putative transposase